MVAGLVVAGLATASRLAYSFLSPSVEKDQKAIPVFPTKKDMSFDEWTNTYSSSSPLIALDKFTPYKVSKSNIYYALVGEVVFFSFPLFDRDGRVPFIPYEGHYAYKINNLKFVGISSAERGFQSREKIMKRKDEMRDNIASLLNNLSEDTLGIVLTGAMHTLDYFYAFPDIDANYCMVPYHFYSKFYSESLEKLLPKRTIPQSDFESWMLPYEPILRQKEHNLSFPEDSQKAKSLAESFFEEKSSKSRNKFLIGEMHNLRDQTMIANLPSASELNKSGFTRVLVGLEMFPKGRKYTPQKIKKILSVANRLKSTGHDLSDIDPSSLQLLDEHPSITALMGKLIEYQRKGIKIDIVGVDVEDDANSYLD